MRKVTIPNVSYPLAWPVGVARSKSKESARFHGHSYSSYETTNYTTGQRETRTRTSRRDVTVAEARDAVMLELTRLGASAPVIISTNLRTRLDGLPAGGQAEPSDPGVAVYFLLNGVETCVAIDRFTRVADNLRAVARTIEALRGIERWGGASLLATAFTGFQGLPAPGETSEPAWWVTLGVDENAAQETIEAAGRRLVAAHHPDKGGDAEEFKRVVAAWNAGRQARQPATG